MGTVTVCSKLPFGFQAEHDGKTVLFNGARAIDPTDGRDVLIDGFGMTPDVDADWFEAWKNAAGDFAPLQTGAIFAAAPNKADAEAKEKAKTVKSGLEQKSETDLGVEVVAKDN